MSAAAEPAPLCGAQCPPLRLPGTTGAILPLTGTFDPTGPAPATCNKPAGHLANDVWHGAPGGMRWTDAPSGSGHLVTGPEPVWTDPALALPPPGLRFRYRNHRGEVEIRSIRPRRVTYGQSPWHPGGPQWLLEAYDLDKLVERTFAFGGILDVEPFVVPFERGGQPLAEGSRPRPPGRPTPLDDQVAERLRTYLSERAANWEVEFPAGPGAVVSLADAAVVAAHFVREELPAALVCPTLCDPDCESPWCHEIHLPESKREHAPCEPDLSTIEALARPQASAGNALYQVILNLCTSLRVARAEVHGAVTEITRLTMRQQTGDSVVAAFTGAAELEARNDELYAENTALRADIRRLRGDVERLMARNAGRERYRGGYASPPEPVTELPPVPHGPAPGATTPAKAGKPVVEGKSVAVGKPEKVRCVVCGKRWPCKASKDDRPLRNRKGGGVFLAHYPPLDPDCPIPSASLDPPTCTCNGADLSTYAGPDAVCAVHGAPDTRDVEPLRELFLAAASSEAPVLFTGGPHLLHSGAPADWKIDCDALTDTDLHTLAAQIAKRVPPFRFVEGVPRGGRRLAEALRAHANGNGLLIVDDVYTTGASLRAYAADRDLPIAWPNPGTGLRDVNYAVIFARTPPPPWVSALFVLTPDPAGNAAAAEEAP